MTCYSVQPINRGRNISKTISKNLNDKYSQKLFDHANDLLSRLQSATDALNISSKTAIKKKL